jgi:hypothetical protein
MRLSVHSTSRQAKQNCQISQLIFNLKNFAIEYRFDWEVTGLSCHAVVRTFNNMSRYTPAVQYQL